MSFSSLPVTVSSKVLIACRPFSLKRFERLLSFINLSTGVLLIFSLSSSFNSLFFILFNKSIISFVVSGASFLFSLLTASFSILFNKSIFSFVLSCAFSSFFLMLTSLLLLKLFETSLFLSLLSLFILTLIKSLEF